MIQNVMFDALHEEEKPDLKVTSVNNLHIVLQYFL